jgi:hypothetical protein
MKKILWGGLLAVLMLVFCQGIMPVQAQTKTDVVPAVNLTEIPVASESTFPATPAVDSSESAKQVIQDKTDQDLTQSTGKVAGTLADFLASHPVESKGWNVLQVAIHKAVAKGLPANMVVLLLLFPVIATIIVFSRYVLGVQSFGVYTPAVLSVAFVSVGIWYGLAIFFIILIGALLLKQLMRKISLPSLSKTSFILWGISLLTLGFLLAAAWLDLTGFFSLSIFPILIVILLSENFMDSQFFANTRTAMWQTVSTLLLAICCAAIVRFRPTQEVVILHPEITISVVVVLNILLGRYTGLRLLEMWRFQDLLKENK